MKTVLPISPEQGRQERYILYCRLTFVSSSWLSLLKGSIDQMNDGSALTLRLALNLQVVSVAICTGVRAVQATP
jgi:hypothetical protein